MKAVLVALALLVIEGCGGVGSQRSPLAFAHRLQEAWFQLKQITSVYVTGLPPDATETEVAQRFSKCGVIKLDEEQRPRVKIYRYAPSACVLSCTWRLVIG